MNTTTSKYFETCDNCQGEGVIIVPCCDGHECGCKGQGSEITCNACNETGHASEDTIVWNWSTLSYGEEYDHETHHSIEGQSTTSNTMYIGTVIFTDGQFTEITDIELM